MGAHVRRGQPVRPLRGAGQSLGGATQGRRFLLREFALAHLHRTESLGGAAQGRRFLLREIPTLAEPCLFPRSSRSNAQDAVWRSWRLKRRLARMNSSINLTLDN